MVRREVSIRAVRGDRLDTLPRLANVAEQMGWTATMTDPEWIMLVQEFADDAAASDGLKEIDELLTQVGSFFTLVR